MLLNNYKHHELWAQDYACNAGVRSVCKTEIHSFVVSDSFDTHCYKYSAVRLRVLNCWFDWINCYLTIAEPVAKLCVQQLKLPADLVTNASGDNIVEHFMQVHAMAVERLHGLMLVPRAFFQTVGEERQYQSPSRDRKSSDQPTTPLVRFWTVLLFSHIHLFCHMATLYFTTNCTAH